MIIGLDFDNTIIRYDEVFAVLAAETGLCPRGTQLHKREVRRLARESPKGDQAWQRLQAQAYGPRIMEAPPSEGFHDFLETALERHVDLRIISHKTAWASCDPNRWPLWDSALAWMEAQGLFHLGLERQHIYFCNTRPEKVLMIRQLGCRFFVDDLEETFLEADFPAEVQGIWYAPERGRAPLPKPGLLWAPSWKAVMELFDAQPKYKLF